MEWISDVLETTSRGLRDKMFVSVDISNISIIALVFMKRNFFEINLTAQIIFSIQAFILLINIIFLPWAAYAIWSTVSVHKNLTDLCILYIFIYFFGYLSKLFLMFIEFEIVQEYDVWRIPLIIATIFRLAFYCYTCLGFIGIVIERLFALHYLRDYESRARRWVFYLAVTFVEAMVIIFTVPVMLSDPPLYIFIVFFSTVFFISAAFIVGIYMRQSQLEARMKLSAKTNFAQYSLSEKYQVIENRLVLQMIRNYMSFLTIIGGPLSVSFVLGVFSFGTRTQIGLFFLSVFDLFGSTSGIGLVFAIYFTIGKYGKEKSRRKDQEKRRKRSATNDGDVYFTILRSSW